MAQFLKDTVKETIKESAVKVFTDKGFKKASIKEIATRAGVSVGNVYRYFDNKEALYSAVIDGVYNGVNDIMKEVLDKEDYKHLSSREDIEINIINPMEAFIGLYRKEEKVFEMLLRGEKDEHYEKTIVHFIDMLKKYFMMFWQDAPATMQMSDVEASALTNAIVFSVIDLLNHVEDDELDETLMTFVNKMVRGYFYMRSVRSN